MVGGGEGLTPWVVEGSSRGMEGWTSPWALVMESGLREAILEELEFGVFSML